MKIKNFLELPLKLRRFSIDSNFDLGRSLSRRGWTVVVHPDTDSPQRARLQALQELASGWQHGMAEKRELLIISSNSNCVMGYCKQAKCRLNTAVTNHKIILRWNRIKRYHNPTSRQSDVSSFVSRQVLLFCTCYGFCIFIWCVFVC